MLTLVVVTVFCFQDSKCDTFPLLMTIIFIPLTTSPHEIMTSSIPLSYLICYSDIIMSAMASQISDDSIVCSIVCSGAEQRKHQSSALLALYEMNPPVTGRFPSQRDCNTENVSSWWRHHDTIYDIHDTTRTPAQRKRDAIIMALIRQNDGAVSFWRKNDVIIARCIRCVYVYCGRNRASSDKMSTWFIREWFHITLKDECHLSSSTPVVITFVN